MLQNEAEIISVQSLSLNCSDQNKWEVTDEGSKLKEISDITKLPCVSRTVCVPAVEISDDTSMSIIDRESVRYTCNDGKYFNYSSLDYPEEVTATCSAGELFQGHVPFWKIADVELPIHGQPLCLSDEECVFSPPAIPELIHTWDGSMRVGTSLTYTCQMDGDRALASFVTENNKKTAVEALNEDVKYFPFRTESKNVIMDMRINSPHQSYIYFASSPKLVNNTYYLKVEKRKLSLYQLVYLWGELEEQLIGEQFTTLIDDKKDIWIAIGSEQKLYIGYWSETYVQIPYRSFDIANLDVLLFTGFSSSRKTSWDVLNGELNFVVSSSKKL